MKLELEFDFVKTPLIFCAKIKHKLDPTNKETIEFKKSKSIPINKLAFTINNEAGFITNKMEYVITKPKIFMPGNITWEVNQCLDSISIKNKSTWNNIKN